MFLMRKSEFLEQLLEENCVFRSPHPMISSVSGGVMIPPARLKFGVARKLPSKWSVRAMMNAFWCSTSPRQVPFNAPLGNGLLDRGDTSGQRSKFRVTAAGSPVTYRCAERMIHGFTRIRHLGPAVGREFDLLCGFLKEHLSP
mgnify:CR=1 FL=1